MLSRFSISILALFFLTAVNGQSNRDFCKALKERKFTRIKKNEVSAELIYQLGSGTVDVVTKQPPRNQRDPHQLVLRWAVTDNNGFYVVNLAAYGTWTFDFYYFISDGLLHEAPMPLRHHNFNEFKRAFLKRWS